MSRAKLSLFIVRFLHQQDDPAPFFLGSGAWGARDAALDGLATAVGSVYQHLLAIAGIHQATADCRYQLLDREANIQVQKALPGHLVAAQAPQVFSGPVPDEDL